MKNRFIITLQRYTILSTWQNAGTVIHFFLTAKGSNPRSIKYELHEPQERYAGRLRANCVELEATK
jgi:hypothetical protein